MTSVELECCIVQNLEVVIPILQLVDHRLVGLVRRLDATYDVEMDAFLDLAAVADFRQFPDQLLLVGRILRHSLVIALLCVTEGVLSTFIIGLGSPRRGTGNATRRGGVLLGLILGKSRIVIRL